MWKNVAFIFIRMGVYVAAGQYEFDPVTISLPP